MLRKPLICHMLESKILFRTANFPHKARFLYTEEKRCTIAGKEAIRDREGVNFRIMSMWAGVGLCA